MSVYVKMYGLLHTYRFDARSLCSLSLSYFHPLRCTVRLCSQFFTRESSNCFSAS